MTTPHESFCRALEHRIDDVIRRWQQLSHEEPWGQLPEKHQVDDLPELLATIFDGLVCETTTADEFAARLVALSLTHGRVRREDGVPADMIMREYTLLRMALLEVAGEIRDALPEVDDVSGVILRFDAAIATVVSAAITGYYEQHVRERGRWAARVEEAMREARALHVDARRDGSAFTR